MCIYCNNVLEGYHLLEIKDFIRNDEETDDRYICFNVNKCVKIFNQSIEDVEELRINITKEISLENIISLINFYLEWLNQCGSVLKAYYEGELGERVYEEWFNDIEVYSADITFNSFQDYGATICCGDQVIKDHILEVDFDERNIEDIRLNG